MNINFGLYDEQGLPHQHAPPLLPSSPAPGWNSGQVSSIPINHFGVLPDLPELPNVSTASEEWDLDAWEAFVSTAPEHNSNDHDPPHTSLASTKESTVSETPDSAPLPQNSEQPAETCPHCNKRYLWTLTVHLINECTATERFVCEHCNAAFLSKRSLRRHQRSPYNGVTACSNKRQEIDSDRPPLLPPPPPVPRSDTFICPRCNLPIPDGESQLHHATTTCEKRPSPYICNRCHTTFSRLSGLRKHEGILPDKNGLTRCDKTMKKNVRKAREV
ncbi:hypothetical protein ONZ45_g11793 [Pleurotus djamor]|nr:hypothetical protein ONZ45_g11793 [Pleurotus djamor]